MDNMGETLENKLAKKEGTKIDIKVKLQYLKNLVDGLTIMHENNFCHLDIKSINILVGQDNIARFIDFGLSVWIKNVRKDRNQFTKEWSPPNIGVLFQLRTKELFNYDIYQLGLVFYFVLLEDKNFLNDRPIDDTTTSADVYSFLNDKVDEKVMKTDENTKAITDFIMKNEMLNFENFKNVPETTECRMKTIQTDFEELYEKILHKSL